MRGAFRNACRFVAVAACRVAAACLAVAAFGAHGAESSDRIGAHLDAGEFAPAIRLAEADENAARRDDQLARIAAAQKAGGASRAAAATAGRIASEEVRARVYSQLIPSRRSPVEASAEPSTGGQGGAEEVDFTAILDLITTTVAPQSWDTVGGSGSAKGFENGVFVDAEGVLRRLPRRTDDGLSVARLAAREERSSASSSEVRRASRLRKVSLPRLERALAARTAMGLAPDETMQHLAGLNRIDCLLLYPETGDLVLAGPAGTWREDGEDRAVDPESGRPVLRLDDWIVVLRYILSTDQKPLGCTITPTEKGLAAIRRFVDESSKRPLAAGERARTRWVEGLRTALGRQEVEVFGIDPRTRAARVFLEADYRMKLVGIGLEEGVLGVPSYMDAVGNAQSPPPLDVLRWWFTLDYDAVQTTPDRLAYQFTGQGMRVMSENQFLQESGKRTGTGKSSVANAEFAHNFTKHFAALAEKYPIYAELKNLCDMALAAALIENEGLGARVGWRMTWLLDEAGYRPVLAEAPKTVESVVAHRALKNKQIVAAISGGVRIDPTRFAAKENIRQGRYANLAAERKSSQPTTAERWWWD